MMEDEERRQAAQTGDQDASDTLDQATRGGESTHPTDAAAPISASDQQPGQTQAPAEQDDVGVPDELEDRTE